MTNWMFLSKGGEDEYINMMAKAAGYEPTDTDHFDYHYDCEVDRKKLVLRGILKYKIMHKCLQDKIDFLYVDSGYFGNNVGAGNLRGTKLWHRVVLNDLQHNDIVERPAERWESFKIKMARRKYGNKIIVAAPDEKPCRYYGIDKDQWVADTVAEIKKHTDRPVIVRDRAPKRIDRVATDPLHKVLADDVHALVTFNSVAGVEAVMQGVPTFVLAPSHAASPVAGKDLSTIDDPYWADNNTLRAWAHHLAYCQFHVSELKNGTAWKMLGY